MRVSVVADSTGILLSTNMVWRAHPLFREERRLPNEVAFVQFHVSQLTFSLRESTLLSTLPWNPSGGVPFNETSSSRTPESGSMLVDGRVSVSCEFSGEKRFASAPHTGFTFCAR